MVISCCLGNVSLRDGVSFGRLVGCLGFVVLLVIMLILRMRRCFVVFVGKGWRR